MSRIAIFGAGGRVGKELVAEARARAHRVTAVVRDPAAYPELVADGVEITAGDVTDAASVAAAAAGHDAVISSVYRADVPAADFFVPAARALVAGLGEAGVGRLVVVGIVSTLEAEPGLRVMDTAGFPEAGLEFSRGRAAELEVYAASASGLDWLVANPPMNLDYEGSRTGRYRLRPGRYTAGPEGRISAADLAVAVLDESDTPQHHRTQVSLTE